MTGLPALSERELEVLELLAQGHSDHAIAARLVLSERTVESYVAQMKRFVKHYMRPPEELGAEEIRAYLLHMTVEEKLPPPQSIKQSTRCASSTPSFSDGNGQRSFAASE